MNIKLALISAGLGNIKRGFEISTSQWFHALQHDTSLEVYLFSGGNYPEANTVFNIARNSRFSRLLRKFKLLRDGCRLEQITFAFSVLPKLIKRKIDIIWVQEGNLAKILLAFKRTLKLRYKIIFCDGAPLGFKFSSQFDYVIYLHPYILERELQHKPAPLNMKVIPHLVSFNPSSKPANDIKSQYKIPVENHIILCVAAWNSHHKRIDYLLKEVAKANLENITLVLCGQGEKEADELQSLSKILNINTIWLTLSQFELQEIYKIADVFILPSLSEGLGAVLIEAGLHGLPIIAHPHDGSRFILEKEYWGICNMERSNALRDKLQDFFLLSEADVQKLRLQTTQRVNDHFHPDILKRQFKEFLQSIK